MDLLGRRVLTGWFSAVVLKYFAVALGTLTAKSARWDNLVLNAQFANASTALYTKYQR
jgi:hypothetical protein